MKKAILMFLSVVMVSAFMSMPVMADTYTGWSMEQDKVVYYVNGAKITNAWVLKGNTLHFMGADGFIDNTQAVDISAAPVLGITNYYTAPVGVKYDVPFKQVAGDNFSAAKNAFNVKDDYEAFLYLYPQYKQTLTPEACYDYYLSSYHLGDTANKYLQTLDGYVSAYTNMCKYGYSYESNFDGTHKSFCACGKYEIEKCVSQKMIEYNVKEKHLKEKVEKNFQCMYCKANYRLD